MSKSPSPRADHLRAMREAQFARYEQMRKEVEKTAGSATPAPKPAAAMKPPAAAKPEAPGKPAAPVNKSAAEKPKSKQAKATKSRPVEAKVKKAKRRKPRRRRAGADPRAAREGPVRVLQKAPHPPRTSGPRHSLPAA